MRIRLVSDLHMEGGNRFLFRDFGEEVIVAAGDIGHPTTAPNHLRVLFPNKEIIYVAGNHEFYGRDFNETLELLHENCGKEGIYFLDNGTCTILGQRFVGATFWTNPPLVAKFAIADFTWIFNNRRCFTIDDAKLLNEETLRFFDETLKEDDVVVTHFLPNKQCIHPKYAGSNVNDYFANDFPVLNKLWLHGHTHDVVDLPKIKCFPYGYHGENNHYDYQGMFIDID